MAAGVSEGVATHVGRHRYWYVAAAELPTTTRAYRLDVPAVVNVASPTEYWRGLGKNLKHYKFDLKHILWQWWLRERYANHAAAARPRGLVVHMQRLTHRAQDGGSTAAARVDAAVHTGGGQPRARG